MKLNRQLSSKSLPIDNYYSDYGEGYQWQGKSLSILASPSIEILTSTPSLVCLFAYLMEREDQVTRRSIRRIR